MHQLFQAYFLRILSAHTNLQREQVWQIDSVVLIVIWFQELLLHPETPHIQKYLFVWFKKKNKSRKKKCNFDACRRWSSCQIHLWNVQDNAESSSRKVSYWLYLQTFTWQILDKEGHKISQIFKEFIYRLQIFTFRGIF